MTSENRIMNMDFWDRNLRNWMRGHMCMIQKWESAVDRRKTPDFHFCILYHQETREIAEQPITILQFHRKDDVSLREDAANARDKFLG